MCFMVHAVMCEINECLTKASKCVCLSVFVFVFVFVFMCGGKFRNSFIFVCLFDCFFFVFAVCENTLPYQYSDSLICKWVLRACSHCILLYFDNSDQKQISRSYSQWIFNEQVLLMEHFTVLSIGVCVCSFALPIYALVTHCL